MCVCECTHACEMKLPRRRSRQKDVCLTPARVPPLGAVLPKATTHSQIVIRGVIIPPLPALRMDSDHLMDLSTALQQGEQEAEGGAQSRVPAC